MAKESKNRIGQTANKKMKDLNMKNGVFVTEVIRITRNRENK